MNVSRSALELTEVRWSCPPATQGTQSCNCGRRCGLLKANGEDLARILIREGLAHQYVCGSLRVRNEKHGAIEANPARPRTETLPDSRKVGASGPLRSRSRGKGAADQEQGRGPKRLIRGPIGGGRLSVHIHSLASGAAGVCMIRPTTSPAGRAAVLQLRATSGRLHRPLQCPFVAERRW